jgi:hypothetical protein
MFYDGISKFGLLNFLTLTRIECLRLVFLTNTSQYCRLNYLPEEGNKSGS